MSTSRSLATGGTFRVPTDPDLLAGSDPDEAFAHEESHAGHTFWERDRARLSHRFARRAPLSFARLREREPASELDRACLPALFTRKGVAIGDAIRPTSAFRTIRIENPFVVRVSGEEGRGRSKLAPRESSVVPLIPRLAPRARSRRVDGDFARRPPPSEGGERDGTDGLGALRCERDRRSRAFHGAR